jgi:hypothetical protein
MARICPSCGHENADDVDFCADCGGYVRWEPTRAAPAVPQPPPASTPAPAPAPAPEPAAQPPPEAAAAPPPVQQARPAPAAAPPPQATPAPPPAPAQAPAPEPGPVEEPTVEKKRRWGRKQKVPGVTGGGVSKPRVSGPRVSAPRVNVGPQGINVSAPRVSAPRVAPPVARAPRLKQPKIPRTPKDVMKAFKKLPGGGKGGGGDSGAVTEGPVAPQPAETWHWDAVGEKSGRGKGVLVVLLLLLFAGLAAAAGWWFFVRDDGEEAAAKAAPAATAKSFVTGLQPLLVRSSRDRARISSAVTGVASCSLAPGPAAQQVSRTVAGRRAVLRRVRRVQAPNAQLLQARKLLEQSLASSAAAGRGYSAWIASFNGACPQRAGPEYATALAANGKAQASKNAFVKAYNPVAKRVGARTWQSTQF